MIDIYLGSNISCDGGQIHGFFLPFIVPCVLNNYFGFYSIMVGKVKSSNSLDSFICIFSVLEHGLIIFRVKGSEEVVTIYDVSYVGDILSQGRI